MHQKATIRSIKKGEYVRLKEDGPVWIRGDYWFTEGKFELQSADDINTFIYRKGSVEVFHGFTY